MGGADGTHDVDLVEEGETVGGVVREQRVLLRKGLYCEVLSIGETLHLVDCCEPSLS